MDYWYNDGMKITKIGHCCLLIETKGVRIMTDPGRFTEDSHILEGIDAIFITHEHADHLHTESLKEIVVKNPKIRVITNSGVGNLLTEAGVIHEVFEGTEDGEVGGVVFEAFDAKHAEIFEEFGQVQNTGCFFDGRFFYPGDAYADLGKNVEILAAPAGGPWCRTVEAVAYVKKLQPKYSFPVHDGIEREDRVDVIHGIFSALLAEDGVDFRSMKEGDVEEF